MKYFDYESAAREAGISESELNEWRKRFVQEYHEDTMMVELRLLRACQAVLRGEGTAKTVRQAIESELRAGHTAAS